MLQAGNAQIVGVETNGERTTTRVELGGVYRDVDSFHWLIDPVEATIQNAALETCVGDQISSRTSLSQVCVARGQLLPCLTSGFNVVLGQQRIDEEESIFRLERAPYFE